MAFTVVPLYNLRLAAGTRIPFGNGFVLQDVPEWLKNDKQILADINRMDRDLTLAATHALVAEYDAPSIGHPDPEWKGKNPKSIQELKFQSAMLANLAIWLRQPAPIRFTVCFHALSVQNGPEERIPVILETQGHTPLFCHPNDAHNPVTTHHVIRAGELHAILSTIPRKNPVWEALRAMWGGLTMNPVDHRYPFFWMALEALFGPNDAGETTFKLCQRIGFFLAGNNREIARDVFKKAKTCYGMRSKIVHGRWKDDPKIDAVMADTEAIARTALRHVIENPDMLKIFISKDRDGFLEDVVFSRPTRTVSE